MTCAIEGKRILVTGGARGIGEAAVRVFAQQGARVAVFDVLDDLGQRIADEAGTEGSGQVVYRHVDVRDRAQVFSGVAWAVDQLGGLDVVMNIAGVPLEDIAEVDLDLILGVNVKGTFFVCQAAFPHLRGSGGSIVNVGSDAALMPFPMGAQYSAAKGAIHALSRTAAAEWGRHGVRVNTVIPAMWTPMYDAHRASFDEEQLAAHDAQMAALIPLGGRLGDPTRDFAPLLVFLASDGARFITGQILSANGGLGQVR
jgi:NAD(P)-dependent dehydrogenase (short-subunit alcohol dehydrogenase family)